MIGREQPDQMLRGIRFTLDFDRLMGVRSIIRECLYMDPSPIASTPILATRYDCSRISGFMLTSVNRGRATMGYSRASSPLLSRA